MSLNFFFNLVRFCVFVKCLDRLRVEMYQVLCLAIKLCFCSFQWNAAKFGPDFSIVPTEGYISPGMEIVFDLTFHPQVVSQEIRYDNLMCYIEHYKPLKLSLTGMCVGTAPVREVNLPSFSPFLSY